MTEAEIFAAVKNYLDMNWQDEMQDSKISGIIKRGKSRLQNVAGASLSFSENSREMELLLDYCLYAISHALSEWETAYKSELIALRLQTLTPAGGDEDEAAE